LGLKNKRSDEPAYLPTPSQIAEGCRLARLARGDAPPAEEDDRDEEYRQEMAADRAARRKKM